MQSFVDFQGGQIHFQSEGQGPNLVLIHGFLESKSMWENFRKDLSLHFRVITPDLPGHGRSSNFDSHTSIDFMAEAINEVLQMLNVDRVIVIGHSMGGYVAQSFAELFPEKVLGFGYFHSHASADSPDAKINRGRAIKVVEENHHSFISNFIPELFTPENQKKYAEKIGLLKAEAATMDKKGIVNALTAMRERKDGYKLLRTTEKPVLFIIGKQDSRAPFEDIKMQILMPKKAHVLFLDEVAHMGFIEDFDSCKMFIKGFVESCSI
jgi:pimeloyl-ACP methyl ester carboxylesterase